MPEIHKTNLTIIILLKFSANFVLNIFYLKSTTQFEKNEFETSSSMRFVQII